MFPEQPLEDNDDDAEDEDEMEAHHATRERLKMADERTRDMSKEEYVHWSECRQASFTFRKSKRFREWCGIQHLTDTRPSDDILDILGFLTFEIVANLTERALKIKEREETLESRFGNVQSSLKRKREHHLFDGPDERKRPVLARHIREAYRQYQQTTPKSRALRAYTGGLIQSKTQVI
jgi:transcription initiation protein SPT3